MLYKDLGLVVTPMPMNSDSLRLLKSVEKLNIVQTLTGQLNLDSEGADFDTQPSVFLVWMTNKQHMIRHRTKSLQLAAIFRDASSVKDWIAVQSSRDPKAYFRVMGFFEGSLNSAIEIEAKEPIGG